MKTARASHIWDKLPEDFGRHLVRAFKEDYACAQGLIHALGGRHSAGTIRLPAQTGDTLSGQVTDSGSPVVDAVAVVRQAGSQSSAFTQDGNPARTTTDTSGNYAFNVPFAPGDYTVVVSATGYDEALAAAMEQGRDYPALLQVRNVGTETWINSGDDPVQFYHEWRDSGGRWYRIGRWPGCLTTSLRTK